MQAQKTSIGIRGGLTIPNLSSGSGADVNPLNEGYSSRLGAGFGIFADFKISKLFSLQPMLEYSQQGGKKNGFQAFPVPGSGKLNANALLAAVLLIFWCFEFFQYFFCVFVIGI
ncbi:hypothetical protein DC498_18305 [Terrimonas sp.]|nr:hypothetical protein DC498_18305 [Terrimonas sp.]